MSRYDDASLILLASGEASKEHSASSSAANDGVIHNIKPVEDVLGYERITNGNFEGSTGWTPGTGITISNNKAVFTEVVRYNRLKSDVGAGVSPNVFESGKTYRVSFEVTDFFGETHDPGGGAAVQTTAKLRAQQVDNLNISSDITESGKYSYIYTAQDYNDGGTVHTTSGIAFKVVNGKISCKIGNVSVREVRKARADFDFDRGTDLGASRINKFGQVETGRQNLIKSSNRFDTTVWSKAGAGTTVTSGQVGHDASRDAFLRSNTEQQFGGLEQDISSTNLHTFSVFLKAGTVTFARLFAGNERAVFDLSGGTVGTKLGPPFNASIKNLANNWHRCSITVDASVSVVKINPAIADNDLGTSGSGGTGTGTIFVQDCQYEAGFSVTPYIETDAIGPKSAGIRENEPRFDYLSGVPHLLMETNRTNRIVNSSYYGSSEWNNASQTKSSTITYMPDEVNPLGFKGCYKYKSTGTDNQLGVVTTSNMQDSSAYAVGDVVTNSVYVKRVSGASSVTVKLRDINNIHTDFTVSAADGWKRIHVTGTADTSIATLDCRHYLNLTNTTDEILVFGHQQEEGNYPTSYIPTHGATVRRNHDHVLHIAGTSTKGITNDHQTTIYFEGKNFRNTGNTRFIQLADTADSNNPRVLLFSGTQQASTFRVLAQYRHASNQNPADTELNSFTTNSSGISVNYDTTFKTILRLSDTEMSLFVNGTKIGSGSIQKQSKIQRIDLIDNNATGDAGHHVNKVMVFPMTLSDAQCVQLTL